MKIFLKYNHHSYKNKYTKNNSNIGNIINIFLSKLQFVIGFVNTDSTILLFISQNCFTNKNIDDKC